MLVLITYDVATQDSNGSRRLRNVAKICSAHGQRVQNSVFECSISDVQFTKLRHQLENTIDKNSDSLRFYMLGNHYEKKVIHIGTKVSYDPNDLLLV